ncbi:four helix bundle protein [Labilibacter sediminis]|nr:four helix bundle protein [Labilibacter sediminis]
MGQINSFRDLIVYQKAYKISMNIFLLSREFPKEEKYSLVDQIRRSSRSICANLAEAWAKRRYEKVFINKLTDCLGEEFETETWLNYSLDCKYISIDTFNDLMLQYEEVRKMLISMINNYHKFCK